MGILKYDKTKPYAFVSYKRQDSEAVLKDIETLQNQYNVNIWCDEDMTKGKKWHHEAIVTIAHKRCKLVIFYASAKALASTNVQEEIKFAIDSSEGRGLLPVNFARKPFLDVYHDEIEDNPDFTDEQKAGAIKLITEHLMDGLTYLPRDHPEYFGEFIKAIKRLAPEIIKDSPTSDKAVSEAPGDVPSEVPGEVPSEVHDDDVNSKHNKDSFASANRPEQASGGSEPAKSSDVRSGGIQTAEQIIGKIYDWFWEYAQTCGIKPTDPPSARGKPILFSTANLEKAFGLVDPSESPRKIKNVALYGLDTGKSGATCGMYLCLTATDKTDKKERERRIDTLKKLAGITKSFDGINGAVKPNLYSSIGEAKASAIAPDAYTKEDISKDTIVKMIDALLVHDQKWFGE